MLFRVLCFFDDNKKWLYFNFKLSYKYESRKSNNKPLEQFLVFYNSSKKEEKISAKKVEIADGNLIMRNM